MSTPNPTSKLASAASERAWLSAFDSAVMEMSGSTAVVQQDTQEKGSEATSAASTASSGSAAITSALATSKSGPILPDVLIHAIIETYLSDTPTWNSASRASKSMLVLFNKSRNERKIAYDLLAAIFKADRKGVAALLLAPLPNFPVVDSIISQFLKQTAASHSASVASKPSPASLSAATTKARAIVRRSHGKEEYLSKKTQEMVCIRKWSAISPLEAAAWCGDNFILRDMQAYIAASGLEKVVTLAAQQLQALRKGKETEHGALLARFHALIQGYQDFLAEVPILRTDKDVDTIVSKSLSLIGKNQHLLPTYGQAELCDPKPFSPLTPSHFKEDPKRPCKLVDGADLDLDKLGVSDNLYKGTRWGFREDMVPSHRASQDLAAFTRLCEVRTTELDNIIKELNPSASSETAAATATATATKPTI